jgi:hypothetical protein
MQFLLFGSMQSRGMIPCLSNIDGYSDERKQTACRYGHDYEVNAQDMANMRVNAKKSPCGLANRSESPRRNLSLNKTKSVRHRLTADVLSDQTCSFGDRCPLGHICPAGSKCKFYKAGKCKFTGGKPLYYRPITVLFAHSGICVGGMHDATGATTSRSTRTRSNSTSVRNGNETRPVTPGFSEESGFPAPTPGAPREPDTIRALTPGTNEWYAAYAYPHLSTPMISERFFTLPG